MQMREGPSRETFYMISNMYNLIGRTSAPHKDRRICLDGTLMPQSTGPPHFSEMTPDLTS